MFYCQTISFKFLKSCSEAYSKLKHAEGRMEGVGFRVKNEGRTELLKTNNVQDPKYGLTVTVRKSFK